MALTNAEKLLIGGLEACGVKRGVVAIIFLALETEEQMMEMCYYIAEYRDATEEELLDKAREIAGAYQDRQGDGVIVSPNERAGRE